MTDAFRDRVAIVTGASRGIGRAVAHRLAERGTHVALVARSEDALEEVAKECRERGVRAFSVAADLSDPAATGSIVERTVRGLGAVHFLVNNAGIFGGGAADAADLSRWDRTIDVNLRSLMHLTRRALPEMEKHPRGAVVNIASISGKQSHAGAGDYCATKHGVIGFSGSVFEDVRERGIKVCAICPGFVATDMVAGERLRREKMIQPDDVAETVLFVLGFPDTGCPVEIVLRPQRSPYR
ncbi:MAG: SDR family oxidoreductase [Gammaproteobacteria bacterium]|nr:SDR family oxidoreductase [Gammaproteobacteria bacterium]NIR85906.1 SDR family oxidoreductase [Gammaproteobacteria bacterium]NIR91898.1 SDR family oxidoreductase [Gammaproteobacteria bacterium]NIU07155.1 SDR family oxidoreductase [Gammaproteobacteria bacterium]NIV53968.1 SDR family NAD(P)-dependent oxidoreductase [Gammaproteobacteria bacterium]